MAAVMSPKAQTGGIVTTRERRTATRLDHRPGVSNERRASGGTGWTITRSASPHAASASMPMMENPQALAGFDHPAVRPTRAITSAKRLPGP